MLRTLRSRLVLSHVLPLLIVLPLAGLALLYILETQVLMPGLTRDLAEQAALVAELGAGRPDAWRTPAAAQAFAGPLGTHLSADLMLLDPGGRVLAATDPAGAALVGRQLDLPELDAVIAGQTSVPLRAGGTEAVRVLAPVRAPDGQVIGLVRLSRQQTGLYGGFLHLRLLIGAVVVASLLIGGLAGWFLALSLERPLNRVTHAVDQLARGEELKPLPEHGPAEINILLRAVNALVERLRGLQQARTRLLANLVHEIGRPLGALHAAIQALKGGAGEDPALQHELLAGMDGEVDRLRFLLDHLAHLHDQVIGTLELSLRPTSLSEWLPSVLAPWREAARQKGLQWSAEVPAGLPAIEIDPDRMAQAVGNLLSNAVKYTPAGGRVAVSTGQNDDSAWIQVSDTGAGITAAELAHIFEPFYRGGSISRFPTGMGLGLTITRDLVEAHGGHLHVDSTPGAGARFTLSLPVDPHRAA